MITIGYDEIINTIMSSNPKSDWLKAIAYGFPPYKSVKYHKDDVYLRFETEHLEEESDSFQDDWTDRHPDKQAYRCRIMLYYGATLIKVFELVSVDGHRALLPKPDAGTEVITNGLDMKVAQIHDDLGTLDEYIGCSELTVSVDS